MAGNSGPDIVTNGLILYLDAANVRNFRGEPTTNLANTNAARTLEQHAPGSYGNVATMSDSPERGDGWKKIVITNRGNNFRIAQFPYITQPTGTTRTYSLEVDANNNSSYYWSIDGGLGYGLIQITNNKVIKTITTSGTSYPFAIFLNNNTTGVTGISETIYYRYYQVEDKTYATPFTETSRGTTVATGGGWVDRTSNANHGELVNGPTYNSANQGYIVFDGTNDYIEVNITNTPLQTSSPLTLCSWVYRNGTNDGMIFSAGGYYGLFAAGRFWYWNNNPNWVQYYATQTIPQNQWYHYCVTYNGSSNPIFYVNGVGSTSTGTYASHAPFGSNILRIGEYTVYRPYSPFSGSIGSVSFYNRVLSESEILQNYRASKSRFGL